MSNLNEFILDGEVVAETTQDHYLNELVELGGDDYRIMDITRYEDGTGSVYKVVKVYTAVLFIGNKTETIHQCYYSDIERLLFVQKELINYQIYCSLKVNGVMGAKHPDFK